MTAAAGSAVLLRARSSVSALYGLSLIALALAFTHPLILLAVAAATFGAARLSGFQQQLRGAVRFAIPLALMLAVINALLVREGVTVLWRFGGLPLFGQVDVTGEAFVYGLLLALRVVVIIAASALLVAIVDPDDVLRRMRRSAFRSALTAALATRMIGVLTRDARRMDQARRRAATFFPTREPTGLSWPRRLGCWRCSSLESSSGLPSSSPIRESRSRPA